MSSEETAVQAESANLPERLDLRSKDIAAAGREELIRLFPEVATEGGKLDFDQLKRALGEQVDTGKERYGMTWPGKADCFKAIQTPSSATLLPCPQESVQFESSENLIIEGDNLEVLKLLQKSYLGKVKMIYIDPPYNTGNDFIYPDNYTESLQTYLEYTGQVDAEGRKFSTNSDTDGRFHSKWLNMMYPRLYLARNLLREDGVVFISMDDHEIANLLRLCVEIFGEENIIGMIVVQVNPRGRHLDPFIAKTHEYVLVVARDASQPSTMHGLEKGEEMLSEYDKEDEHGKYRELGLRNRNQAFNPKTRPNLFFPLFVDPRTGRVALERASKDWIEVIPLANDGIKTCWTWGKEKISKEGALLVGRQIQDGSWRVFRKDYLEDADGGAAKTLPKTIWTEPEMNNDYGRRALKELFGEVPLDFPKSPDLIKKLAALGSSKDSIVLDFFAGAGTTAQSVLELNSEDGGRRKFILVQLPEPTGRDDYPTIADICKQRVRRVIEKMKADEAGHLPLEVSNDPDRGYQVFKLNESNFTAWDAQVSEGVEELEQRLELHVDHLREGRTDDDLLYEILLKSGFPLTTKVQVLEFAGKRVFSVADGALLLCLDRELNLELIREIAQKGAERVVCLDDGFAGNDQLKTNAVQIFKSKGIASFKTV